MNQIRRPGPSRSAAFKLLASDPALETRVKVAVEQRIEEVPHLGLRLAAEARRDFGRRMHLHGEPILRVEEFEEQRKTRRVSGSPAPKTASRCSVQSVVQRCALQWPFVDDALRLFAIDDFPRFADPHPRRKPFVKMRFEAPATPDPLHEERLEDDRLG